jgi:hypothetical protein
MAKNKISKNIEHGTYAGVITAVSVLVAPKLSAVLGSEVTVTAAALAAILGALVNLVKQYIGKK